MFGQRNRLRRLAAHMLLVWLFALASSIVNACVADHGPQRVVAASAQNDLHTQHPHHHAQTTPGDEVEHVHWLPTAESGACAKFCVDNSTSTPVYKQQLDPLATVWLAPPPTASAHAHIALQQLGALHTEQLPFGARIPIPIAYLRLTL
jgi:hypothetical protein